MSDLETVARGSTLRRLPKQDRSRERVDEILNVAIRLIGEKGIDAVTMKEVAQLSGGPIASVYQYFPNKSAIIATLYERYNRTVGSILVGCLSDVASIADLHAAADAMLAQYATLMAENPALLDLVNAVHADKSLQNLDIQETEKVVADFYEKSRHLFPEAVHIQYRRTLFLMIQLTSATVRMALAMPEEDGAGMRTEFAAILHLQIDRLSA